MRLPFTIPLYNDDDIRWSDAEAAAVLGQSLAVFRRHLKRGEGPPYVMSGRYRQFRPAAVRQWRIEQERAPGAQPRRQQETVFRFSPPRRGRPAKVRS